MEPLQGIARGDEIELHRGLNVLKNLIRDDDHLAAIMPTEHVNNDKFLAKFIRVRKYDCDRAHKMLKEYYCLRRKNKKMFMHNIPSIYKPIFDGGMHVVLKHRDPHGRKVFIFRTALWEPDEVALDQIICGMFLLLEGMVDSEETQKNGVLFVADQHGLSFKHFKQFRIPKVLLILNVLQGKFPLKCKGLHNVNDPHWLQTLGAFAKPFFSVKLQKRVHFHGEDFKSLHKHLPPSILPSSLGGNLTWEEAKDQALYQRIYAKELYFKRLAEHCCL